MNFSELINHRNEHNVFAKYINVTNLDISEGYAKAVMIITENHYNIHGTIHGGALFSLADIVAGSAASSRGEKTNTLDASVYFIAPGIETNKIYAEAGEAKKGRTIRLYDVNLYNEKDQPLLKGVFSFFVRDERD